VFYFVLPCDWQVLQSDVIKNGGGNFSRAVSCASSFSFFSFLFYTLIWHCCPLHALGRNLLRLSQSEAFIFFVCLLLLFFSCKVELLFK
jgi:hypothetical protein